MTIYYKEAFAGGRAESHRLLELAIADHIKDSDKAGRLVAGMKTGRMGKPYIDGFDCFSISHSNDVWAVLFDGRECGLDIQHRRNSDILSISGRIYSPRDEEMIRVAYEADPEEARAGFFRIWTRREALAKAMGGTVFDSGLPSVSEDRVIIGERIYTVKDIELPYMPELFAAICVEGDVDDAGSCIYYRSL